MPLPKHKIDHQNQHKLRPLLRLGANPLQPLNVKPVRNPNPLKVAIHTGRLQRRTRPLAQIRNPPLKVNKHPLVRNLLEPRPQPKPKKQKSDANAVVVRPKLKILVPPVVVHKPPFQFNRPKVNQLHRLHNEPLNVVPLQVVQIQNERLLYVVI